MPTEARPAFLAITGRIERETDDAALRFAVSLRNAAGGAESHSAVVAASTLATRAFAGERDAWAPLVEAVVQLLASVPPTTQSGRQSRRELLAFVGENADLIASGSERG